MLLWLLLLLNVVSRLSPRRCGVRPLLIINDLDDLRLLYRYLNVVSVKILRENINSSLRYMDTLQCRVLTSNIILHLFTSLIRG